MTTFPGVLGCNQFAIGPTANDLARLSALNIPVPDRILYKPCQGEVLTGNMDYQRFGYQSVTWQWKTLSLEQARLLSNEISTDPVVASTTRYIHTSLRDGRTETFHTFRVTAKAINWGAGKEGQHIELSKDGYENVVVTFIIQAEVATVVL
jgi:hypothetical protein